jgi:hypothetical protein
MAFLEFMNFINLQITQTFSIEMSFLQALKGLQLVLSPMENEMAFLKFMNFINLQIKQTFSIEMSFLQALNGLQLVLPPMENEMAFLKFMNFTNLQIPQTFSIGYIINYVNKLYLFRTIVKKWIF